MRFGESLARLVGEIGEGYTARKSSAGVRAAAVADVKTAVHDVLAMSRVQRAAVTKTMEEEFSALRDSLVETRVTLGKSVADFLSDSRDKMADLRTTQAASAKSLQEGLEAFQKEASAKVEAFRWKVRDDHAEMAKDVASKLADTVAKLRVDVAGVRKDVQDQFDIARGTWGASPKSTGGAAFDPAPAKAAAKEPRSEAAADPAPADPPEEEQQPARARKRRTARSEDFEM
jgi:hypothetical protein